MNLLAVSGYRNALFVRADRNAGELSAIVTGHTLVPSTVLVQQHDDLCVFGGTNGDKAISRLLHANEAICAIWFGFRAAGSMDHDIIGDAGTGFAAAAAHRAGRHLIFYEDILRNSLPQRLALVNNTTRLEVPLALCSTTLTFYKPREVEVSVWVAESKSRGLQKNKIHNGINLTIHTRPCR